VTVFQPTIEELEEIYEIREALEPLATNLAAKRLAVEELDELEAIVEAMRTADPVDYVVLNQEFHRRIYVASGRPRLTEIISTLREASTSYTGMTVRQYSTEYREHVQEEHEAILEALRKGAGSKAATLIRKHLSNNQRHVASLVGDEAALSNPADLGPAKPG
jgi:DNA-binding GntR family transcriptional regulator